MKKITVFLSIVIITFSFAFLLNPTASAASEGLNKTSVILAVGEEDLLMLKNSALDKAEWSSSDESVVTVEDGRLRGISTGTAVVTAKCGSDSCTAKVKVSKYRIQRGSNSVKVGNRLKLGLIGWSGSRVWSSSDESIATVSADGVARGVKAGKAVITVAFGDEKLSFTLTVTEYSLPFSAGKVSYLKYTPRSHSEEAYQHTNSLFVTDPEKIKEVMEYMNTLRYSFIEPQEAARRFYEDTDDRRYTKSLLETDTLFFYSADGNELARVETSTEIAIKKSEDEITLNRFIYKNKCYEIAGRNEIINRLYGWRPYDEFVNAAKYYLSGYDIEKVRVVYICEASRYEKDSAYRFESFKDSASKFENGYVVHVICSYGEDNEYGAGGVIEAYFNPYDEKDTDLFYDTCGDD